MSSPDFEPWSIPEKGQILQAKMMYRVGCELPFAPVGECKLSLLAPADFHFTGQDPHFAGEELICDPLEAFSQLREQPRIASK